MTGRHSLVEIRFETKLETKAAGPEQATSGSGPIDLSLVFASVREIHRSQFRPTEGRSRRWYQLRFAALHSVIHLYVGPKIRLFAPACKGCYTIVVNEWSNCPAVERHPDRVSGAWVFKGTRVPVLALFENLEDGATVSQFLEWFPGVSRDSVDAVLEHAAASLAVDPA